MTITINDSVHLKSVLDNDSILVTEELDVLKQTVRRLIERERKEAIEEVRGQELAEQPNRQVYGPRFFRNGVETTDTDLATEKPANPAAEFRRAEAIELVTAMVAGAGFELIRDIPGETAMWVQHLPSRPAVQVFLQVKHAELVESSPAQLFASIRSQVGVA